MLLHLIKFLRTNEGPLLASRWGRLRRMAARAAIKEAGAGITPTDLWLLLSTPPCLAHDTVYTVSMCAATGHICTRASVPQEQREEGAGRWRYTIADAMTIAFGKGIFQVTLQPNTLG